jgi:hypothetical protein
MGRIAHGVMDAPSPLGTVRLAGQLAYGDKGFGRFQKCRQVWPKALDPQDGNHAVTRGAPGQGLLRTQADRQGKTQGF